MSNTITDILYWNPAQLPWSAPTRKQLSDKKRAESRSATQERHSQMRVVTRELKIRPGSAPKHEYMRRLFVETRWCYNWYLQQYNDGKKLSKIDTKDTNVIVLAPYRYEVRNLIALSSQMRDEVKKQLKMNLNSLFSNLKNGNITHGTLRYKRNCNEIPLKAGKIEDPDNKTAVTFTLNKKKTRVHLQGAPFLLKVNGGGQLPEDAEIACGKLVHRAGDYFLQVTYYVSWEKSTDERAEELLAAADALEGVGFDFGIDRQVVDDLNNSWCWFFEESERYKEAQRANDEYRRWHRRSFGWSCSSKHQLKIMEREREVVRRRKKAAVDSFVGAVRKIPGVVALQNEQLAAWAADSRYSGTVHHSVMGGLIARLKKEPATLVVSEWVRTTGVCPDCGHVLSDRLDTSVREWDCPECGEHHDRDQASARVILLLACVMLLYPDCPSGLSRDVFDKLCTILTGCGALALIRH